MDAFALIVQITGHIIARMGDDLMLTIGEMQLQVEIQESYK